MTAQSNIDLSSLAGQQCYYTQPPSPFLSPDNFIFASSKLMPLVYTPCSQNPQGIIAIMDVEKIKVLNLSKIDRIIYDQMIFEFKHPLEIIIFAEDGGWYCEAKTLSILAFGSTSEAAFASFQEDFSMSWKHFANESDSKLEKNAQTIKRNINDIVSNVKEA